MLPPEDQALLERRARLLGPAYRLFYEEPFHPVRGEGVWLYDAAGKPWLDAYNNVVCVGHARPEVVEAIARQASTLNTHTRYLHEGVLDYAERLLATLPPELGHATFTCTGSEANDLAMRVARAHTGGTGLIVTHWAYHGVTSAIAEASPSLGQHIVLGANVRTVPAPAPLPGQSAEDCGRVFAEGVRAAVADLKAHGIKAAALMVDTVFSSDGIFTEPAGFLREAVEAIHEAGGVFIADEVQPGFARTGECFWGFQRHGIVPDMVTMGKPMGNGHPVAGMAVRPEVMAAFGRQSRYFNTFGGNPVSMAAAAAVLDVIQGQELQRNALEVGAYLRAGLVSLADKHALVGEVRGAGLFIGLELVTDRVLRTPATAEAAQVVNGLRRNGVLLSATGETAHVLKIRPPLVFTREHADLLVSRVDFVLGSLF
ncbi:aminotransferase class III-fold pyridoxal phosphate-dependent enzyme [Xylophilus rhododendri]|uniref:Aminotransferase class III-fold pyridoxal phosphate-dependent enzyme n=1 Tax=Xylophilus rhododendri TaxID=2697032 RepID=A0A857IZN6_9BURK|nr:aspartate aminotransferase family protein [Xylophilus rhododendri]QHI97070.1 aminotransferase class III-fold pyridoxal phosphate-dependent enzyme [Xylophilus rhododendri]